MEDTKMFLLINEIGFDGSRVCLLKDKKTKNKAGYTATSCGRVGRGGNARFPTFRLDHYGPTDGPTDGQSLL